MRFHFGMSFRAKSILKYIGLGLIGLLAFMGVHDFAKAETIDYTTIVVNQSNGTTTSLSCGYNSAGMCPTNITMFPQPPKTEYLMRYLYISFGNNQLVNGHNYNFQIQFHILRPPSDTAFEQESFLLYLSNNTILSDNTIYWNYTNYYDSMYGEEATQFNYSGSFTSTNDLSFFTALTMENQEGIYGVFIDSVYLFDNDTGQEIIDSSTQNTIDIMNNQNQNTQNVINNNNSNTQEIKDTINDNLQSCRDSLNLLDYNSFLFSGTKVVTRETITLSNNTGSTVGGMSYIATGKLPSGTYTFINYSESNGSIFVMQSASDYSHVVTIGNYYTFTYDGSSYLRFLTGNLNNGDSRVYKLALVKGNMVLPYEQFGQQLCKNKIDNLSDSINNTNQSIDELNDTITDETLPTIDDSTFGDLEISSETAISDLITMPITILRALNNNLGDTCSPYTIPFGLTGGSQTLTFPCIHPEEYLGSTIWNYIDLFICFFMIYNIAMLIISSFESITSLEDTFNSLYEPRHADTGYKPKHGGGD